MKDFPKNVLISGRVKICLDLISKENLKNKIVVDIGSSFGWLEKEIAKINPKKLIGIEMDEGAVNFAKKNIKGVDFLVGTALNLPLEEKFADIVILFDVLEHVPKGTEEQVLDEIDRIIKPNG